MQVLTLALEEFARTHNGVQPAELLVTRGALLVFASDESFRTRAALGSPVRVVESFSGFKPVEPGAGTRLGFFLNDNSVQLHVAAVELAQDG